MSTSRLSVVVLGSALLTGCAASSENASLFGTVAGSAASTVAGATGMPWPASTAMGYGITAATAVVVDIIAKHEASERQRQVAEANAKAAYAQLPPAEKKAVQKKRYIAVDTRKDERIQGAKAVMVYDTKTEQLVGDDVYDIKKAPPVGSTAKFDTVSATYVGS